MFDFFCFLIFFVCDFFFVYLHSQKVINQYFLSYGFYQVIHRAFAAICFE